MLTIDSLLDQVRANLAAKLEQRKTHTEAIDEIRSLCMSEKRDPSDAEATKVTEARSAQAKLDEEIKHLDQRKAEYTAEKERDEAAAKLQREITPSGSPASYDRVINRGDVNEPRTYTPSSNARGVSWFQDVFRHDKRDGNPGVEERLQRHAKEVEVHAELTQRAAATGSFAGLIVPQYLVDQAALLARAGRPFANSIGPSLPLPEQGMTFQIPRGTTGASAAVQATENTSVSSTDEVWANLTVNVATVAGQQDVSRQSLERGTPGIDQLIYNDLAGAYNVAVDQQVLSGSGSSGQVFGVVNTAGVNQATAYGAAVIPSTFYSKVAGGVNAIETTRFMAPTGIAMHPRRWNWLLSQVDTSNRPLAVPIAQGPFNAMATDNGPMDVPLSSPVGMFQGLPVVTDASIPASVGTGPEDIVIVYRKEDLLLWEDGDGMPRELRFEQTLGNQLTVKLVCYGYIAFTAGRYPTSVALVGGNAGTAGFGQIAPTF